MKKLLAAVSASLLIVGCASTEPVRITPKASQKPTALYEEESRELLANAPSDVVCRKKRRTGSHFLFMVCKSKKVEDAEMAMTQDELLEQQLRRNIGPRRIPRSLAEPNLPSLGGN